jgi:hypothetical protein
MSVAAGTGPPSLCDHSSAAAMSGVLYLLTEAFVRRNELFLPSH